MTVLLDLAKAFTTINLGTFSIKYEKNGFGEIARNLSY